MIDRIIQLLVLCLGCLLIFLVGHLLLNELDGAPPPALAPAPAASASAPVSRAGGEAEKSELPADELATKRVKTVPVRPDEPIVAPQKP